MRVFIVEDDLGVTNALADIVEKSGIGIVCGTEATGGVSIERILTAAPDVILVDFLLPVQDGIQVVKQLRQTGAPVKIVMISQVSNKKMVSKAYSEGIDFFIGKPINMIEIRSVLSTIDKTIRNEKTVASIRQLFDPGEKKEATAIETVSYDERLRRILAKVGMAGEKGTEDIVRLCCYLAENRDSLAQSSIDKLCAKISNQPKTVEQRIRRAIAVGLSNVAHLGTEDFMNETFEQYAHTLFSFEEVRAEMEHIRCKSAYGGKVNIRKFIDSLMLEAERKQ